MSNNIQFRNFLMFDHTSAGIEAKTTVFNERINSAYGPTFYNESIGTLILDSTIIGNSDSSQTTSITESGLILAWDRGTYVKNVKFYNFPNAASHAIRSTEITGRCTTGCGGWTSKFTGLTFNNRVLYRTNHRWDWDYVAEDLDGSLTGRAGDVVVFNNNLTKANSNCRTGPYLNGIACANTNGWIRFAFNEMDPNYVLFINYTNTNDQMATIPRLRKRLTHPFGYMAALDSNQEYYFIFDQAEYPTNISYTAAFYSILPNKYLLVKHQMLRKPDLVSFGNGLSGIESLLPLTPTSPKFSWHWNNDTSILTYMINNLERRQPFLDISVGFKALKCRYAGCQPPVQPGFKAPVTSRPANALFWSNLATWQLISREAGWGGYNGLSLPRDGDNVKIPEDYFVVVDCPLPRLNRLQIEGVLEFDNGLDHYLEVEIIFINGGQLIVGWENDPILTNVEIALSGVKDSLNFQLPNGFEKIGGKGIGVYGGLDVHGRPRTRTWTTLQSTALAGTNTITLVDPVDWLPGEQIVLTTTSFKPTENDVMTILTKSANNRTLTLTTNLTFGHVAFEETLNAGKSYRIAGAVGLLTRNVKITGKEYASQLSDLYGSRIVVADYSFFRANGEITYYKGFARLSNVELNHPGQFSRLSGEDTKYGILFSNLGVYNSTRPNYVKGCAFHHGYHVAIGISGSAGIPIEDNVIYHTIDFGMKIEGHSNIIRRNLVCMNYWASSFITWEANFDIEYWAGIGLHHADSVVLENNFIAGSERNGILFKGSACAGTGQAVGEDMNHSIRNNIIHGALSGVTILPKWSYSTLTCIDISTFTVFKSAHWGIYYQGNQNLRAYSNILVDNQVNIYGMVFNPNILSHEISNKEYNVSDTIIVGQSTTFNCVTDVKANDLNFRSAKTAASFGAGVSNENGKVGLVWANFHSGPNGAPYKPW